MMAQTQATILTPTILSSRMETIPPNVPPPTPVTGPVNYPFKAGAVTSINNKPDGLSIIRSTTPTLERDQITVHILDRSTGNPAAGVKATLISTIDGGWPPVTGKHTTVTFTGSTDDDGRIDNWYALGDSMTFVFNEHTSSGSNSKRIWQLKLDSAKYWQNLDKDSFMPEIDVKFYVDAAREGGTFGHWHISILLGQWGFTASKGS